MKSKLLLCVGGLSLAVLVLIAAAPEKKINPVEAARLNNLGCAYMNQQLFEKAQKAFADALAHDPNLTIAKLNEGVALAGIGKADEAKQALAEAAKLLPKDPHVWYSLGLLDKNSADPQAAVEDFKHVIELDDSDADTWYFLGTVYSQLRQFPQAIESFQHALKLNPNHASAQFGLSRADQQSGDSTSAHEHLTRFQYITQHKLGSAMSLAYGEQGKYSLAEDSPAYARRVPPQIPVKFADVTKEAGLTARIDAALEENGPPATLGPGACFLDYDNDGKIDLLLTDHGANGGVILYHNLGNGKFEDLTQKAGLDPAIHATACTAGDYDNDGYTDLAISGSSVVVLHNEKNGTFKDVTSASGIGGNVTALGLTFIDYDHDGDLDLLISGGSSSSMPVGESKNITQLEKHAGMNLVWRNNGNGTFTNATQDLGLSQGPGVAAIGSDYNNDRAIDIVQTNWARDATLFENPREGAFRLRNLLPHASSESAIGATVLDFDHDGWMDLAFTRNASPSITLLRNAGGKSFEEVKLPETSWARAYGIAAFDYDNDGWVDLVAVGQTQEGKGEIKLFRNLGPEGWKDVTADVGLDKIQLKDPRAIITGDYDNDGSTDLLITQNHGPAVLLKNAGGNKNNWLRLALKGLNSNKSAIGTKVEVFSDGIRQKYEIYGSNGYLGQNSPYLTVGLSQAKQADVVRMLWPGGVLQDEIEVAANKQADFQELDRRGSSCPTLFVWDGKHYELVADVLGAGVIGHWVAPGERNIPRPVEWVKVNREMIPRLSAGEGASSSTGLLRSSAPTDERGRPSPHDLLRFRIMEPMEEVVYLDQVKLVAVDHPANEDVYPNEYFASNPPYPDFKVVTSRDAKPPAGAWDDKGNNLLPDLLAHKYVGNFELLAFKGFAEPHTIILDLGEPYRGGPLRLLMHGEIEYFTATGMYAASQAGIEATAPYVEAEVGTAEAAPAVNPVAQPRTVDSLAHQCRECDGKGRSPVRNGTIADRNVGATQSHKWVRILGDMGFPAGLPRTITTDLSGKLPIGTNRIRITTNLQIYWDSILLDRSPQRKDFQLREIPLFKADLGFHGYPKQIEDLPPGNVKYVYEQVSRTGPYARQAGEYTRYGDVKPLLSSSDDKLVVFGSGEEVQLDFDSSKLPPVPAGWTRDYFFMANGYEKDMDFYAAEGSTVEPLPFRGMGTYPYPGKSFPQDAEHLDYMLKYNTRFVSGNEPRGYTYEYGK